VNQVDGRPLVHTATEQFTLDGRGTLRGQTTTETLTGTGSSGTSTTQAVFHHGAGTGWLAQRGTPAGTTAYAYDAAGQLQFEATTGGTGVVAERGQTVDALGRVRGVDDRTLARRVVEAFRYDGLGRRVWQQSAVTCAPVQAVGCLASAERRTVWAGEALLGELQVPPGSGADTGWVPPAGQLGPVGMLDPAPFYGRVGYTPGRAVDQPLSVTRLDYPDRPEAPLGPGSRWEPVTLVPWWTREGQPARGTFGDGAGWRAWAPGDTACAATGPGRCVRVTWLAGFTAYDRVRGVEVPSWQGSLLADRRTGAGLAERRARLYDPGTGRFTQPDPLGWAGGATPYGFADGDPLNRTDPFGLCPMCVVGAIWAAYEVGSGLYDVYSAVRAVSDPRLGTGEKITAVALATVGFLGPGGGLTAGAGNIRRVLGEGADLIGRPGRGRAVREVSGGLAEALSVPE
jgi:RHS repeat-associated protein